jgi:hypothetical protein
LEELITPGKNSHFMSIVALNEMTADMREICKLADVRNPVLYIPVLSKKLTSLRLAFTMISALANP